MGSDAKARLRPRTGCGAAVYLQPPFGKGPARSAFEVAFEFRSSLAIGERYRCLDSPRTELGRVRDFAGVVSAQAISEIVSQAGVEVFGTCLTLQNVHVTKFHWLAES